MILSGLLGVGSVIAADDDGDGICDEYSYTLNATTLYRNETCDAFPRDETQWSDRDGDGLGDNQSGKRPDLYLNDTDNDGLTNDYELELGTDLTEVSTYRSHELWFRSLTVNISSKSLVLNSEDGVSDQDDEEADEKYITRKIALPSKAGASSIIILHIDQEENIPGLSINSIPIMSTPAVPVA